MDQLIVYLLLFSIIVIIAVVFDKSTIPMPLILVVVGMGLSFIPYLPKVTLSSELVLDFFLPLLIYEISAFSSFRDIRKEWRAIASLSVGHVIFITTLVALTIHTLIPQIGWPLAFVCGAIISPPDDVAIVAIAEKIHLPERIFLILEGEGMFNDAAALTIFRFALAAAITHHFSAIQALSAFLLMVVGEIIYGFLLGYFLGEIRKKIHNTTTHLILSLLTPFFAYLPAVALGGTGIIATAIVGFIIGNQYAILFTPEFRLTSRALWPALFFSIESLIFLLVGLNLSAVLERISTISLTVLFKYVVMTLSVVIIGRFIWVFASTALLLKSMFTKKTTSSQFWRNSFIVSWAGIRGGISLAAALAMPVATFQIDGVDVRDLLIFIVFSIIVVTLVLQGLSLPLILRLVGFDQVGKKERYQEHLAELDARTMMVNSALDWLYEYQEDMKHNKKRSAEIEFYIHQYEEISKQYKKRIAKHEKTTTRDVAQKF